jgi:hypothetical protein
MKFKLIILYVLIHILEAQNIAFQAHRGAIRSLLFTDDQKLITASDDFSIKIWNVSSIK